MEETVEKFPPFPRHCFPTNNIPCRLFFFHKSIIHRRISTILTVHHRLDLLFVDFDSIDRNSFQGHFEILRGRDLSPGGESPPPPFDRPEIEPNRQTLEE